MMSNRVWSRALVSAAWLLAAGCRDDSWPGPGPEPPEELTAAESHTLMGLLAGLGVDESDSLPEAPELPFTIACPGGGRAVVDGAVSDGTTQLEVDLEIGLRDCVLSGDGVTFTLTADLKETGTVVWTVDGLDFTVELRLRMAGEFSFDVGDRHGYCHADFTYSRRISTEQNSQHVAQAGRICGHDLETQWIGRL